MHFFAQLLKYVCIFVQETNGVIYLKFKVMYYEIRHRRRVEAFKSFIDSLPYRIHDYLKNGVEKLSINEIDELQLLILS